jgi:hypothetical protein
MIWLGHLSQFIIEELGAHSIAQVARSPKPTERVVHAEDHHRGAFWILARLPS